MSLDDVILAGIERGLTMSDMRKMRLGEVVDYCYAYNERQKEAEDTSDKKRKHTRSNKRKANQNDINAFFG